MTETQSIQYTLQMCKELLAEKEFHRKQSLTYFRLFNDLVPEEPQPGQQPYTPLQEWLQERAQHHAQQMFLINTDTDKLQAAVNKMTFHDAA